MDHNLSVHEQHELRVLELVEERDKITQRGVATELEIAVGMANALIKRLVLKGYIKVKDAPSRRYGYYITLRALRENALCQNISLIHLSFLVKRDVTMMSSPVRYLLVRLPESAVSELERSWKLPRWCLLHIT